MMIRRLIPALFLFVFALIGAADSLGAPAKATIYLRAQVDRRAITIGDRIKYTLEITAGKGTVVELPKFANRKIGDFEIKDSGSKMESLLFWRKRYRSWYYITSYATGTQTIPEIDVKFRSAAQKDWSSEKTPSFDIKVESVLPKGVALSDIKDVKAPLVIRNPYYGILSLSAALFILLLITVIIYRRMKQFIPVRLPHETALEELEAIRAAFLQGGDIKVYYVDVSGCIRHYIEHAFRLKAPEMTTEEFLDSLRDSPLLSSGQKDLLKGFMSACDMVKFAKYAPTREEAEAVYATAKTFVEETKEVRNDVRV